MLSLIELLEDHNKELSKEIENLKRELEERDVLISNMRDVLRYCSLSGAGTYYQQQCAKIMLLHNKKAIPDRNNPDGTYNESWKKWVFSCGGQDGLDLLLEEEKILLGK